MGGRSGGQGREEGGSRVRLISPCSRCAYHDDNRATIFTVDADCGLRVLWHFSKEPQDAAKHTRIFEVSESVRIPSPFFIAKTFLL